MTDLKLLTQIANDVAGMKESLTLLTDSAKFKKLVLDAVLESEDRRWRELNIVVCGLHFQQGGVMQAFGALVTRCLKLEWFNIEEHTAFAEQIAADKVRVRLSYPHVKSEILRAAPTLGKSPATRGIFINNDLTRLQANEAFKKRQAKHADSTDGNTGSAGVTSNAFRGGRGGRRGGGSGRGASNSQRGGKKATAPASVPPLALFDENAGKFVPNRAAAPESDSESDSDQSSMPALDHGDVAVAATINDPVTSGNLATTSNDNSTADDDTMQAQQVISDRGDQKMQPETNDPEPSPHAVGGGQSLVEALIGAVTNVLTPRRQNASSNVSVTNSVVVKNSEGFKKFVPVGKNSIPSKIGHDNNK